MMPEREAGAGGGVLLLCTANVCRSPMAAALLARALRARGVTLPVSSAGMLDGGRPALPEAAAAMAAYGADLSGHRSRGVTVADLAATDLLLAMSREHLRHAVVMVPGVWPRAFTLKELVRRGEQAGPRRPGEPLARWLVRAHAGRSRAALLGDVPGDDVPDPAGGPASGYAEVAALLDRLVSSLCDLCLGHGG